MRKYLNNANNASLVRRSNAVLQNPLSPFSFGSGLFDDLHPLLSSPFQVMERMHQDMDRLFSHVLASPLEDPLRSRTLMPTVKFLSPTVDVSETEKDYRIEIDLPGVAQDAIDVTVVEGTLTIRAEMQSESSSKPESEVQKERQYHYRERRWGSFERIFHLPSDAQEEDIRADFTNGVLTLTIAKKAPEVLQPRGHRIAIGTDSLSPEGSSQIEAKADSERVGVA